MTASTAENKKAVTLYDQLMEKHGPTIRTADVAKYLHCHPSHVRALCQSDELPAVRIGGRWFIPTAKFAALLEGDAYER